MILHRDVQGTNVVLTREDDTADVRLIDFGIAHVCYEGEDKEFAFGDEPKIKEVNDWRNYVAPLGKDGTDFFNYNSRAASLKRQFD